MLIRVSLFFFVGACLTLHAEGTAFRGLGGTAAPVPLEDPYATVGQLRGFGNCTATLISPYVLLTAAHCVWDQGPEKLKFTLDRNPFWNGKPPLASVREIHVIPIYRRGKLQEIPVKSDLEINDLALLNLDSLDYGPFPSSFLPLSNSPVLFQGKEMIAPGYGVNANGSHSQFRLISLVIARFFAVPDAEGRMIPSSIIGMEPVPGKSSACHGDSGGPLIFTNEGRREIVAVASANLYHEQPSASDHCLSAFGTVYTNVYHHREWITAGMNWQPPAKGTAAPGLSDKKNLWKGLPVIKGK